MNINPFVALLIIVMLGIASFIYNVQDIIGNTLTVLTTILFAVIGGVFYFIMKIATIFEAKKEVTEYMFNEMKKALENNNFSSPHGEISRINALFKLKSGNVVSYYVVINDNLKVLRDVLWIDGSVIITDDSTVFLQENFMDEDDLANYIKNSTRLEIINYEVIHDNLVE